MVLEIVGFIMACLLCFIMGAIIGGEFMKEYLREFGE